MNQQPSNDLWENADPEFREKRYYNPYTNQPILNQADYDAYSAQYRAAQNHAAASPASSPQKSRSGNFWRNWFLAAAGCTVLLCLCAVLAFSTGQAVSGKTAENQAKQAWSTGYDDGYDDGYGNGYGDGARIGKKEGYQEGHNEGYESGRVDGVDEGYYFAAEKYQENFEILMQKMETPYPDSGDIFYASTEERYAPFEIVNPGDQAYFIKVYSDDGETQKDVLTFFVRPNSEASVSMPLGNYKVKYAMGSGPWYGEKMLFGPETQTYAIAEFFPFTADDEYYRGHTLTLRSKGGGNLVTDPLPLQEF